MLKFSIITPINKMPSTFNKCIQGIESQKKEISFEWIIVLNGSEITPKEIDKILHESHIRDKTKLITFDGPEGPSSARNFGMENSLGKYFIFLDSDDYFQKNFLEEIEIRLRSIHEENFAIASNGNRYRENTN